MHAQPRAGAGAARGELGLERFAQPDQDDLDVREPRLERKRGRDRHAGAVIAPHAIDGYGNQRNYSPLVFEIFLPR